MCVKCIQELQPEVGTMCKSRGADMTNFKACAQCGAFKVLKMKSIESTTDEDDETGMYNERIIYQHLCAGCDHLVAEHFYEFSSSEDHQEYSMECHLCGEGSYRVRIKSLGSETDSKTEQPTPQDVIVKEHIMSGEGSAIVQAKLSSAPKRLGQHVPTTSSPTDDSDDWD